MTKESIALSQTVPVASQMTSAIMAPEPAQPKKQLPADFDALFDVQNSGDEDGDE